MADKQGSGCGLVLGIIALLIGVPLFILVIAISGGEEPEPQASCRPGTTEDASAIPEEYQEALESAAAESGLSVDLLAAQIETESGWDPEATSPVGAQGLAQFMPQTWATYGDGGDPFNAQDAIAAMGRYMAAVSDEVADLAGNERELAELSLAAYNAGPGAVQNAGGIPGFTETEEYVKDIMASAQGNYSADCSPVGGQEIGELGTGEWTSPLPGAAMTSNFGARSCPILNALNCSGGVSDHRGIDFAGPSGSTVVAPMDLEIRATGVIDSWGQLGWVVLAKQPEAPGLHVEFAHCAANSIQVNPGDTVAPGTPLCTQGNTGSSAGEHLHFQVGTPNGDESIPGWENLVDPAPLLREKGVS